MKMMKNKKGIAPILIILIIGLLIAGSYYGFNLASISGTGNYIERPVFKYVKCEAISSYKYSEVLNIPINGEWLGKPTSSNSYDIIISYKKPLIIRKRIEYWVCNSQSKSISNCRIAQKYSEYNFLTGDATFSISNVKNNEYVWVQFQTASLIGWKGTDGATYQIGFIPYGLREYDVLSGSANPINPNDCSISSYASKNDYIKGEDLSKIASISPKTNENVFQPEEVRWYVSGYLTSASPSFMLTYKNQDAWCRSTGTSGEIYKINEIVLGSGTYKIASADWSDLLGTENCCPKSIRGDEVCSNNFQWEKIQGSECGAFKSCGSPNWVPYSEQQIIKYSCVNGYCNKQIKEVDCASDYDCKDTNQICDLNKFECVDANVNLQGQEIKTIPDNKDDCETKGGTWITQTTEEKSLLNYLGIGSPKIIVQEYCDLNKFSWAKWITIGFIIIVLIVFHRQIIAIFKLILNKLGIGI